jgi:hypothetical protein
MSRHLLSSLILLTALGFYAVGLAKPAEALVFIAMGLELWFWARVSRDTKERTVSRVPSDTKSNQKGVAGL